MDNLKETIIDDKIKQFYNNLNRDLFNEKQLSQIDIGYKRNLNISWYSNPKFNHAQMFEIRIALQNNLTEEQLSFICNEKWNNEQMREIRLGMIHGIDYTIFAETNFSSEQMRIIRIDLE